jgi:hypothetical protein
LYLFGNMAATVQGAYFFRNRVRSIPMYIGMSNDFYRPTKIASCAPGFRHVVTIIMFG